MTEYSIRLLEEAENNFALALYNNDEYAEAFWYERIMSIRAGGEVGVPGNGRPKIV